MRAAITTELLRKLPTGDVDIYDTKYRGLVLRCRRSGAATFRISYGRGKWITLGRADVLTPKEARELARDRLAEVAKGVDPAASRRAERAQITFAVFVRKHYTPWAVAHKKTGAEQAARLLATFGAAFEAKQLDQVNAFEVERWRSARLKAGKAATTVNRDLNTLRAALRLAVRWKLLQAHPLADVKALRVDRAAVVRYLTDAEEKDLREALKARDRGRRAERLRANTWRAERRYDLWPPLGVYTDHLTPIVVLALNTGLRRGELFSLRWRDVDIERALVTVQGGDAKSGQTRHVPLNAEAAKVLKAWHPAGDRGKGDAVVFPGADGGRLKDIKAGWLALVRRSGVKDFRFHDCRHSFASRLVMRGVDLNTVRELLGHADLKMTLRYAHLAPEHKAAAVARLVRS